MLWVVGAVMNAYAMGMAGSQGMLRRTIYEGGQWQPYVLVAMVGGILMGARARGLSGQRHRHAGAGQRAQALRAGEVAGKEAAGRRRRDKLCGGGERPPPTPMARKAPCEAIARRMNSRERVLEAMAGGEPDRVPCALSFYHVDIERAGSGRHFTGTAWWTWRW